MSLSPWNLLSSANKIFDYVLSITTFITLKQIDYLISFFNEILSWTFILIFHNCKYPRVKILPSIFIFVNKSLHIDHCVILVLFVKESNHLIETKRTRF